METLEITVSHERGRVPVTVFRLKGRANLGTAEQLQTAAQEAVAAGARALLLDLTEVVSVTSIGLQTIQSIYKLLYAASPEMSEEATRQGTTQSPYLKLLNPRPDVLRVLQIAGFDTFLEIHDNLKDAVASF